MANNITASEIEQRIKEAERLMSGSGALDTEKIARAIQQLHLQKALDMAQQPAPQHTLEVRDIERLAKAGVAINFEQIKAQIRPDTPDTTVSPFAGGDMIRALYDRWAKGQSPEQDRSFFFAPWTGAAFKAGNKVMVLICTNSARGVLLEDDFALYPSDALLASLIMMLKTETSTP